MNTRSKGNRAQQKCIEYFTRFDYKCAIVERTGKWIQPKDMFGLFDIVAIRGRDALWFVQVCCNRPHVHKDYVQFAKSHPLVYLHIAQFVWINYKGFVMYVYHDDGEIVKQKLY